MQVAVEDVTREKSLLRGVCVLGHRWKEVLVSIGRTEALVLYLKE